MIANDALRPCAIEPRWWFMLLMALVIGAPPLLINLDRLPAKGWHENICLATAQETWIKQHAGNSRAWVIPTINDSPRWAKPPLIIWLQMLMWSDLEPASATSAQLTARARLASAMMGLILIAAVFWMGCVIFDNRLGLLASLIVGTSMFVQDQARMATYDIALVAWCATSVAGALWAIAPFKPTPHVARALSGWLIFAIGLALAWMSKGPLALLIVCLGVLPALAIFPQRRMRNIAALMVSLALAALFIAPWYWALWQAVPNLNEKLFNEYRGPSWDHRPPWYYLSKPQLTLPWTLWLLAGLVHVFAQRQQIAAPLHRTWLVPFIWFIALLLFFSIAPPKVVRYILPLAPAAALLAAMAWRDHQAQAERGKLDRGAHWLMIAHWSACLLVSVGLWPFTAGQAWMIERGWMSEFAVAPISVFGGAALTIALTALALLGWRRRRRFPLQAAVIAAVWMAVLSTVYCSALAKPSEGVTNVMADARSINELLQDQPLRYLRQTSSEVPDAGFLFHTRRIIPQVQHRELPALPVGAYVMADATDNANRRMTAANFEFVREFSDSPNRRRRLWVKLEN